MNTISTLEILHSVQRSISVVFFPSSSKISKEMEFELSKIQEAIIISSSPSSSKTFGEEFRRKHEERWRFGNTSVPTDGWTNSIGFCRSISHGGSANIDQSKSKYDRCYSFSRKIIHWSFHNLSWSWNAGHTFWSFVTILSKWINRTFIPLAINQTWNWDGSRFQRIFPWPNETNSHSEKRNPLASSSISKKGFLSEIHHPETADRWSLCLKTKRTRNGINVFIGMYCLLKTNKTFQKNEGWKRKTKRISLSLKKKKREMK